jgi:hypothetical protein
MMALELTFKQVCEFIKKDQRSDAPLIEAVDKLLGLTLICAQAFLGPAAVALLPTIAVKNEMVRLGKSVFKVLTSRSDQDYLAREQRMQTAYTLICYTAFFDALDQSIPQTLRTKIGLSEEKKTLLARGCGVKFECAEHASAQDVQTLAAANPIAGFPVPFPHPTETLEEQLAQRAELWRQMSQGFAEFVRKLDLWKETEEKEQAQVMERLRKLPEVAAKCFQAHYFELARRYEDFAVWANLQEHRGTGELIGSLSEYVRQHAALMASAKNVIDIGLAKMHDAVLSIPETLKTSQAAEICDSLKRHYEAKVVEPIVEERDMSHADGSPVLRFPRICDAFIPQSHQVLRYVGKARSLEDQDTWQNLPRREDLGMFLLSYLTSPYSTETPLVILGHPGSGKSLLTKILSARLMSSHFTVVRVPLREVNPEAGVVAQIEERIRAITHVGVDSWAKLSRAFKNNPPLLILDGYDELLQASGTVFKAYLNDVKTFQTNESEQGRPVRVIVTSRITLVDKVYIPDGSTVIRLMEFDRRQRDCWIGVWNRENASYFRGTGIAEFALPDDRNGDAKILSLGEQPLLLLMLALYDSEDNSLRKRESLDRTILYDSLLRRFVSREMAKDRKFQELSDSDQGKALDSEMQRLGVAALGMYNRRKLHILSEELNADIKFFGLERPVKLRGEGRELSQAELLLGRFFFVYKSEVQVKTGAEHREEAAAFEFLHNTFGEFLTADFVLRQALFEVWNIKGSCEDEDMRAKLEQNLGSADGLSRGWFSSLVYTPLFTRPVVLQMMREWVPQALKRKGITKQDFLVHLDTIILNQVKLLLEKREMPSIIRKETTEAPFGGHPLLGHIAIYSMNLMLLRVIVSGEFVFDESQIGIHEDGARPWDRLTHIWRSWFALENLNGVTAMLVSMRRGSTITLTAKGRFQLAESQSRLETYLNVAVSLGDDISAGLTGLLCYDESGGNHLELSDIDSRLRAERMGLDLSVASRRLSHVARKVRGDSALEFGKLVAQALALAVAHHASDEELTRITSSVQRGFTRLSIGCARVNPFPRARGSLFCRSVDTRIAWEISLRNASAGLALYRIAKELRESHWLEEFGFMGADCIRRGPGHRVDVLERDPETMLNWMRLVREIGHSFRPEPFEPTFEFRYLLELTELNPEAIATWVQLVREAGGGQLLRQVNPEFLKRVFNPSYLLSLAEINPEAALAWAQLATEAGCGQLLEHVAPGVWERVLDARHLLELAEFNPQVAVTWVQVLERFLGRVEPGFFARVFDPPLLLRLAELSPEAALACVQLARGIGDERFARRLELEVLERIRDPRHVLRVADRNPEVALTWLQLVREIGGDLVYSPAIPELSRLVLDWSSLPELLTQNPAAFATVLWLVRASGREARAHSQLVGILSSLRYRLSGVLSRLPISALPDLKWLMQRSDDQELAERIREWLQRVAAESAY